MNKLEARECQTPFWSVPHLSIFVDGERLDEIVHRLRPDDSCLGLIPALMPVLNPEEETAVWERALGKSEGTTVLPLLICPDDVDLFCTMIVTEMVVDSTTVTWNRLGLEVSRDANTGFEWIGSEIDWIEGSEIYTFPATEYHEMLRAFGEQKDQA